MTKNEKIILLKKLTIQNVLQWSIVPGSNKSYEVISNDVTIKCCHNPNAIYSLTINDKPLHTDMVEIGILCKAIEDKIAIDIEADLLFEKFLGNFKINNEYGQL